MPGVFGLACQSPAVAQPEILAAMCDRMMLHPWYAENRHIDASGRVSMGSVSRGQGNRSEKVVVNEDRTLLAVMDGEINDYKSQRQILEGANHQFEGGSHAELLLHGYEQDGAAFCRSLHGKFSAAIWDSKRRRLILVNDRFGMKPLYYIQTSGRLLFASALRALLVDPALSRRTNLRGLAQFFTFGQLLGEETLLEDIRVLPAAAWLEYSTDDDRLTMDRYWRLEARRVGRNTAESLERIDAAFHHSVERCTADTEDLGLSLSGGLDARTILALAAQPDRQITTLTSGMSGNMDHRSASAMAKLAGCPHHQVVLDETFLASYETHLRNMVRLTDGQYLCQCIVMPTLPVYRDLGIRVLLRGHAGELLHMTKAYNFSLDQRTLSIDEASLQDWLWQHLQAYMLNGTGGRLFAPAHRNEMESLARESLRSCLKETEDTEPAVHRIWQLFLNQRLRRETALSMVEFDSVVETRLPYIDNELIDELFAAPPELKMGDTIQRYILGRHRPDFLDVVNVNTGTVVGAGRMRRAVSKFRMRVLAKLGVKGYQPYERLGLWLRRELKPLVESLLLSDRSLDRGYFDPQTVRTVVADHLNCRHNHTYLVLAMLIFEMSQRELVDAPVDDPVPDSPLQPRRGDSLDPLPLSAV